jgi:hypothetical protein
MVVGLTHERLWVEFGCCAAAANYLYRRFNGLRRQRKFDVAAQRGRFPRLDGR